MKAHQDNMLLHCLIRYILYRHVQHCFCHHPWWQYVNIVPHSGVWRSRLSICFFYGVYLTSQKLFAHYYFWLLSNTPNPISAIQSPTSNGRPRPETGRRGLPLFRDDKLAGIVVYASWWLNVLLSRAPRGFQRGFWRVTPLWVWSPPRHQAEN